MNRAQRVHPAPTGPAFSEGEYARRQSAVRRRLGDLGIDVLLVSDPANMNYLTGYDAWLISAGLRMPCESFLRYYPVAEDNQRGFRLQPQGEHYDMADGVPQVIDQQYNLDTFAYYRPFMRFIGPYPLDEAAYDAYEAQSLVVDFRSMDSLAAEIMANDAFRGPLYTEEMPLMGKHGAGLIKICEKYWVKMLTEENFDANWAEFQAKLTDRNIDLIDGERTDYWARNN